MRFEDTGLPDTPLMRKAFHISWFYTAEGFTPDPDLGHMSPEDEYRSVVLKTVEYYGYGSNTVSETAIAATMVEPSYQKNPAITEQLPEEVNDLLHNLDAKMTLIAALTKKIRREEVTDEDIERYMETIDLTADEGAMLKASLLGEMEHIHRLMDSDDQTSYIGATLHLITKTIPLRKALILVERDEHEKLDQRIQDKFNDLLDANARAAERFEQQGPDNDGLFFG